MRLINKNPGILIIWGVLAILFIFFNQNNANSSQIPTVSEILRKTVEVDSKVDYVGKRIVIIWNPPRGDIAFEERVIHKTPSTHVVEVIQPEVITSHLDDKKARKSEERHRKRRRMPPPHEMQKLSDIWRENTQLLMQNYTIDTEGGESIAGRKTYLLNINPKKTSRPKNKVWLDTQYYNILRIEHYDIHGNINSLSVFTTIDYSKESVEQQLKQYQKARESEKEIDYENRPYRTEKLSLKEAEEKLETQIPQPSHFPVGFELQDISMVVYHDNLSIHFIYTDGLSNLSLFVSKVSDKERERHREKTPEDRNKGDRFRNERKTVTVKNVSISIIDPGNIRILHWKIKQNEETTRFVLIGELSQEEMLKMAESMIR